MPMQAASFQLRRAVGATKQSGLHMQANRACPTAGGAGKDTSRAQAPQAPQAP